MASDDASDALINKLQSADLRDIHQQVCQHLSQFNDLLPHPAQKPKRSKKADPRELAKNFLSFLSRALSLIPKRLSETPKLDESLASELFDVYGYCLDCMDCISSQLSAKPHSIQKMRVRYLHCLEAWERFLDAEKEGFSILESLKGIGSKAAKRKKPQYVPELGKEPPDSDLALLIVEIVVTLVKCNYMIKSKEEEDQLRLLNLVENVKPWFRILDASTHDKLHKALVSYLSRCALFLVGELRTLKSNLVSELCIATFAEYSRSCMKDQTKKFACRACSSLLSQSDACSQGILDVLISILDYIADQCKDAANITMVEFLEIVDHCSNKCRTTTQNLCFSLATYLSEKKADDFSQDFSPCNLILELYAAGLLISYSCCPLVEGNGLTMKRMDGGSVTGLPLSKVARHDLAALLGRLKLHFPACSRDDGLQMNGECKYSVDSASGIYSRLEKNGVASISGKVKDRNIYLRPYCDALRFCCQPLAEFVYSTRKEIISESQDVSLPAKLSHIQEAFHQFCSVFLCCHSTFEWENNEFDVYNRTIRHVAMASLALSFRTKLYLKENIGFIKQVIFVRWVQANDLKFLFASLHNMGVTFHREKQIKEASEALKVCCLAAWALVKKLLRPHNDVPEDVKVVGEACAASAFLLDLLYQCDTHLEMTTHVVSSLRNWCDAQSVLSDFSKLPVPSILVKQWVKIECKHRKDPETVNCAATLYSLLSSSGEVSKKSAGIILEQELLAYKEMSAFNPLLCKKMKLDIISVLLADIYVTKDSHLQRSKVLITKGRELRSSSIEQLNDCIQCLSEAIILMASERADKNIEIVHVQASAYILRALCKQEAQPDEIPLEDIHKALDLWQGQDCFLEDYECDKVYDSMLILLYHVVDMLSIKGCTLFETRLYELLIRLFKRKNISLEKCLALLWKCRRLGHGLCTSPVSEAFISSLSPHCGELSRSIDFWTTCMNTSWRLKVDEVKKAASDLASRVPLSGESIFVASHLYHDLAERMLSNGLLTEALSYANAAHGLRSKLFQEKFKYTVRQQSEIYDETGVIIQKRGYTLGTFEMHGSAATACWPHDNIVSEYEGCVLTPWNTLQCYLESTLQLGIIHELIGNGPEADTLLIWGKNISNIQGLPQFEVAFSSVLGRLYRKQQLWDLAKNELSYAKQKLSDKQKQAVFTCSNCRTLSEVTIDLQLGDLYRSRCYNAIENAPAERLRDAETHYNSALEKLNDSAWKNHFSNPRKDCVCAADQCTKKLSCLCNKKKCFYCLPLEVKESRCVTCFVRMKWELARRHLSLRVLSNLGKCFGSRGEIHEARKIILQSTSLLVSRNPISAYSSAEVTVLPDLIGKDIPGDQFAVERATLLYYVSFFTLKSLPGKINSRIHSCDKTCKQVSKITNWLMLAFILCREVPTLVQKVSRLLSAVFVLSASTELFPHFVSPSKLSESYWASFFHQASLGTHLNHQLISIVNRRQKVQESKDSEDPHSIDSTSIPTETLNVLRGAPETLKDLKRFMLSFIQGLPCTPIICISLFGGALASLLNELLDMRSHAWILLSRLSLNSQPVVVLLPVNTVLEDVHFEDKHPVKGWRCPWAHTVVDDVAPVYRMILEENYLSSSVHPLEDTQKSRSLWWMRRKSLDQQLGKFLKDIEDVWLGPWKNLLLGELSDCKHQESVKKKLVDNLKDECELDLDNSKHPSESEECILPQLLSNGCSIGGVDYGNQKRRHTSSGPDENSPKEVFKVTVEAAQENEEEECPNRKPVILVLDLDVQMLPWENLPILRDQEVYRMPSIGIIYATLDRCCQSKERTERNSVTFPLIDPLDGFFLLNPGGDLHRTQVEFEDWFRGQNLEGKAGTAPTIEELTLALRSHDLFIYFGHGSGAQYIPGHEVEKLEQCAATFLMGCSSGSLFLDGCYSPQGAPLSYLLAGSPVTVGNLWEVTDKDIDRFGKVMLDSWLRERSTSSEGCVQCNSLAEKLKNMEINGGNHKGKQPKKRTTSRKKKVAEPEEITTTCTSCCNHRPKIGSFMSQAREACTLPYLTGAAPVCYGVPTGISKKKDL